MMECNKRLEKLEGETDSHYKRLNAYDAAIERRENEYNALAERIGAIEAMAQPPRIIIRYPLVQSLSDSLLRDNIAIAQNQRDQMESDRDQARGALSAANAEIAMHKANANQHSQRADELAVELGRSQAELASQKRIADEERNRANSLASSFGKARAERDQYKHASERLAKVKARCDSLLSNRGLEGSSLRIQFCEQILSIIHAE